MRRPIATLATASFATFLMTLLCQSNLAGQNLLQLARNGNTEEIEKAIKADPTALDRIMGDNSMLHTALEHGQVETVKKLIELGADVDLANSRGRTALHFAIQRGDKPELFDLVMAADPSLNHVDENRVSPFLQAIYYGHSGMAKKLANAGCDVNVKDRFERPVIYEAASNGMGELVELLIENGGNVRESDSNGTTAFMMLCHSGQLELVKEHFDIALATQVNNDNQNCLSYAAFSNSPELVEYLCEKTDLENTADQWGRTPLLVACEQDKIEIAKILLKHGANPDTIPPDDSYLQLPLIHAAFQQNSDMVEALLAADANVSISNAQGNQALHAVCGATSREQRFGQLPRSEAGAEIIDMLLEKGADPNVKNEAGQTPLAIAVANNFPAGIDKLIKRTTEVDLDLGQTSLLYWACRNKMPNTVTILLNPTDPTDKTLLEGSKVNTSDQNGQTPLCLAAAAGDDEVVRILLANKADPNLAGDDGQLPLNCALAHQNNATEMLLAAGASSTAVDGSGRSPIQTAGWYGNEAAIKLLAKQSVNLSATTQSGSTALHFAAWQGHKAAAETLIDLGVAVDVADADGWTPLHKAAVRGDVEMIKLLLGKRRR